MSKANALSDPAPGLATRPSPWRFAPAFLVPVVILACAWFVGPPQLYPDTATGLLAWRNFAAGGAWNTIPEPSPADLTRDVLHAVTWWSPGQYVPLGLLGSAGLSLGASLLLVALLSAWSLTAGLVCLARGLGAPEGALPWLALAAASSWHTLYPFGMFIGGEVALVAVLPWILLAGWQLRNRVIPQIIFLPALLLVGSFAKHSFAIYALGLLAFLWLEALRDRPRSLRTLATATLPLAAVGVLYVLGRRLVFPPGATPSDPGQLTRTLSESLGFSAVAPLLAATGGGSLAGRAFMLLGLPFEAAWQRLSPLLMLLTPACLAFYVLLARARGAGERLAGVTALVTVAVMAWLLWQGGSISLEDRHFGPAGLLLLAVFSAAAVSPRTWIRGTARALIVFAVIFGTGSALQRHRSIGAHVFQAGNHISVADLTPGIQEELLRRDQAAAGTDAIIYLAKAELSPLVHSARLIVTDGIDHDRAWFVANPRHGRVSTLTLVVPAAFARDGRLAALQASFLDYPAGSWTRRTVDGWDFWQAVMPPRPAS